MRWFQATAKSSCKPRSTKGRRPDKARSTRRLTVESLEGRTLMSASPLSLTTGVTATPGQIMPAVAAAIQSAAPKAQAQAADRIFNVNIQLGGGIISQITNVISELRNMEASIDAVLGEIPGWHLTADVDKAPTFSGRVTGSIDEAANGAMKSASLSITVSADASATIEGYYGVSVFNIGLGATAELDESLTASASYSTSRGWAFGGSLMVSGTLTGSANATVALWKGDLYAQGNITSIMSVNSSGTVSGSLVLSATVGADIQDYSLLQKQWVTYWNHSIPMGQKSYAYSFNAVSLFQSGVTLAFPSAGIIV